MAVRQSATLTWVTRKFVSGIPAQRAELVRREAVPIGRIVPYTTDSLRRLEDQAVASTWGGNIDRRDFINTPISPNRVDEAKARVRHLAFDSFVFRPSPTR